MPRVRFGLFDFDPESGELRREGVPLRLQAQPAQVLAALVARPGEIVTREELRQTVWGEQTFVDFDRGLNYCIAQIRTALGDSAESPRYVRTIPKRGYQFVAPVAGTPAAERRVPWKAAVAAAVVLGCLAGGWLLFGRARTARIAVARFDNETGSADMTRFADGLTDAVVAELTTAGAGRYEIVGNAALLRRPRAERDLSAIATSLGAGYVVLGQVQARPGGGLRVLAHLIRLPQQTHVWVVKEDAPAVENELSKRIADEFLRHLSASPIAAKP